MRGRKERQVRVSITVQVPRTLAAHGPSTRFRGKACRVLPDPHSKQGCFIPYGLPFPSSESIVYLCLVLYTRWKEDMIPIPMRANVAEAYILALLLDPYFSVHCIAA